MKEETLWSLIGSAAAITAGMMARKAATEAYERRVGDSPPADPAADDVGWRQALLWGATTGLLVGVARVIGRRAGSEALRRSRGRHRGRRALERLRD